MKDGLYSNILPLHVTLLKIALRLFMDHLVQQQKCDEVGQDHQAVEEIGEVLYQLKFELRPHKNREYEDEAIPKDRALTQQKLDRFFAEVAPADEG